MASPKVLQLYSISRICFLTKESVKSRNDLHEAFRTKYRSKWPTIETIVNSFTVEEAEEAYEYGLKLSLKRLQRLLEDDCSEGAIKAERKMAEDYRQRRTVICQLIIKSLKSRGLPKIKEAEPNIPANSTETIAFTSNEVYNAVVS